MNLNGLAQVLNVVLTLILIARLLALRIHSVYRLFCAYLIWEFSGTAVTFIEAYASSRHLWAPDYTATWMFYEMVNWVFYLSIVQSLLGAMLERLPGIRKVSRKILIGTFIASLVLAALSVEPEYARGGLQSTYGLALSLDRAICSMALLVLVVMLAGLLWVPVEMSRNLAVFSAGFLVYFGAKTSLLLARSMFSHESFATISIVLNFVSSACFLYWTLFLTAKGETVGIRLGSFLAPTDRDVLAAHLASLNASLMRSNRRT